MSPRIVLADPMARKDDLNYFRRQGFSVYPCSAGADCLEIVERNPPDLLITELVLTDMNAVELISEIRNRTPLLYIMLLTAYRQSLNQIEMQCLKADVYTFKPMSPELVAKHMQFICSSEEAKPLVKMS